MGTMSGDREKSCERYESLLDGTADQVSGVASKIIRVFLSSTFSDMTEERNMLLKEVYPRIQEYTKQKYGVNFQMVDMRWGVTNEVQNDHMTSACCLNEIRNCQRVSIGPNFVAMLGQKYGYRPLPAFIDADEFETIYKLLENKESDLSALDVWYLKDENAVPPQYVLQPINSILKNYDSSDDDLKKASRDEWQSTFEELRALLMVGADLAFDDGKIGGQTKQKYFNSVTEEEIDQGLLENTGDVNKKCLCFVRTIQNLRDNINHHRALKYIDLKPPTNGKPAEIDTEAQDMLKILRENTIPQTLNKDNIVRLSTTWSEHGGINSVDNVEYLTELEKLFYDKMTWLVDQNLADNPSNEDDLMREVKHSLQIRNEWSRVFFGRDGTLGIVKGYLKDVSNRQPFAVYGESGCGKTALIAKCAKDTYSWMSKDNPVIIVRFLGTSPQCSHILLLLVSMCEQICDVYNLDKSAIPSEYKDVVYFFQELLHTVSKGSRPLYIYIDSVDQLATSFEPYNFRWLPRELPPNIKIIMSLIPTVFNLLKRFYAHIGQKNGNSEPIAMLGDHLCMDILKTRLSESDRTITAQQSEIISKVFSKCGLPLFSRIMLEEVHTWKSYTSVSSNMVSSTLKDALDSFFHRLELNHGTLLVRNTLGYITAARNGISEMEILDLLSLDDDVLNSIFVFWLPPIRRLPPFLWTRLRLDLDVFLVTRDAGDVEVLTWYHRLFAEVARERYLGDEDAEAHIHSNMAEYFMGMWAGKQKSFRYSRFLKTRLALTSNEGEEDRGVPAQPLCFVKHKTGSLYNKRKIAELPYHLVKCRKYDILLDTCVFNYYWLWTKISVYGLQLLLDDFDLIQRVSDDNEVRALADALRIAGHTLNSNPDCLSLEITGRLLDLLDSMPKIRQLFQQCDAQGRKHSAIISPLQLYEVPISSLTKTIEGFTTDVADVVFVKRDTELISISVDGNVSKWDVEKGSLITETNLPKLKTINFRQMGLFLSQDEKFVICECRHSSQTVYTLDTDTLKIAKDLKMTHTNINHSTVVGKKYCCLDNAVYDLRSMKKVRDLSSYKKTQAYVELAFTINESHLLIGGQNYLEMYTVEKAKRAMQIVLPHTVSVIKVTSDGRLAIVGLTVECTIKLYDINVDSNTFGHLIATYDPDQSFPDVRLTSDNYATSEISEICISNKQGAFVSLVKRKYPIIWSLRNVSTKPRLLRLPKDPKDLRYLFHLQFTSDDRYVLAVELSPLVMMWNSVTGDLVAQFRADLNNTHILMLSTRSNMAVTVPNNGSVIKLWDLQKVLKMEEVSTRKEQPYSVRSLTFSSQSNLIFISRVHPPKSSKAYHYIDYFQIEVLDLTTGKTGVLLPFDKYGSLENITISKDASVLVLVTGTAESTFVTILDMNKKELICALDFEYFKGVKLSRKGDYLSVFLDNDPVTIIYSLPEMKEIGTIRDCMRGTFTKKNAFVGISGHSLIIRAAIEEEDTLKIDLPGDITTIHYCDVTELLLVTVDSGLQVSTVVFKAENFGVIGTMTDVSNSGISDVADNGTICIDAELQVFELERCKRVKRLLPDKNKAEISSVRLSSGGDHAVFIDTMPSHCIRVCRVNDSQTIATSLLHCVPEALDMIPALDVIVVLSKDKNMSILSIRDCERKTSYTTRSERIEAILGVGSFMDPTGFEFPPKVKSVLKENTKSQQMKTMSLDTNLNLVGLKNDGKLINSLKPIKEKSPKSTSRSSSCVIL